MKPRKTLTTLVPVVALAFAGVALVGCEDDGPAEEVGENIDEAIDDTGDAIDDAIDEVEDETGGG